MGLISDSWERKGSLTDDQLKNMFDANLEFEVFEVQALVTMHIGTNSVVYLAGFNGGYWVELTREEYLTVEYTRKYTLEEFPNGGRSFCNVTLGWKMSIQVGHPYGDVTTWKGCDYYEAVQVAYKAVDENFKQTRQQLYVPFLLSSLALTPRYDVVSYYKADDTMQVTTSLGDNPRQEEEYCSSPSLAINDTTFFSAGVQSRALVRTFQGKQEVLRVVFAKKVIK